MAEKSVAAPTNQLVSIMNIVIDALIKGLGEDVAYAAAVAEFPFLGAPFISTIFKLFLGYLAGVLDDNLKNSADIIVIRFQNDERKSAYDEAIKNIQKPGASDADIQAAKDAINALVSRNK